ncbi:hypothetical protein F2P56_022058 [Juglans regia]|uniref:Nodulation-signaling pathway 2 protein-like n=2 Tax=Juglans regia TaxID=51240 RepID=A0A833X9Z9_JUGRE|nr:protein NODULATION SIGNALING PATHWAY 2-like [Juglans regia]KAF5457990.1 hypothetical protein F2P56_022058 [Juglans regia]
MENEQFCFPFSPSYYDGLHDGSLETSYSLQTGDPFSPNTMQGGIFACSDMERLFQTERELVNIDSIYQDTSETRLEGVVETELGCELNQDEEEQVGVLTDGNSPLKIIQEDQLMEDSSLTDLLLMGAEAVEDQNWLLASTIIAKLNNLLLDRENGDNSFHKLAMFFTQGLHYRTTNTTEMHHKLLSRQINTTAAFQMLQELSPCVKFAHFTANQAILEASQGEGEVHVIDFDIMEGMQWPPLMVDLAMRKDASFKVTAIVVDQENAAIVHQTGRRLKEFADLINLPFTLDQMVMEKEEDFARIKVGRTLIANCMMHRLQMQTRSFSTVNTFLAGVSRLSPKIVVLVEEELYNFARISSMSFVEFFCEALRHYAAFSDSLAISSSCGGYKSELRLIEKEFLGIRILDSLRQFPYEEERMLWGNGFGYLKGFKPIPISFCNISQAKYLVSLFSGGYWVKHENCRLALCWKSRPLTTASIWVPKSKPR